MLFIVFSLATLAIAITSIVALFYGIILLIFNPEERSFHVLKKIAISLVLAVVFFLIVLLLTNTFLAHTNS